MQPDTPTDPVTSTGALSLARRLLIGATLWSVLVVIGGVFAMSAAYRAQAVNLLDEELDSTLVTVSRAINVSTDGTLIQDAERLPRDPRFEIPLSGRYWMALSLASNGGVSDDIRPRSVWDGDPPLPQAMRAAALSAPGTIVHGNGEGPAGESVRIAVQAVTLPQRDMPVLLLAAADRTQTDDGANRLRTILLVAMVALAAGTLLAMSLGLRFALRPFEALQADINDVREGRRAALREDHPAEVRPLTEALNRLLEHNRAVVSRAQTHVGNLAHALKTPLAVLRNEALGNSQLDRVVQRQTRAMHENVDHYLKRAQAAARAEVLGARAPVRKTADGLARMMNRLHERDDKSVDVDVPSGLLARAEPQDLDEMLGNLVDNACKWAESQVIISAREADEDQLVICIDDDGPGLNIEERSEALKRGVRLDETAPGTGLGLSIVSDLADMHGGSFSLEESHLGGLRAKLTLGRAQ
ncbi:MAG: ATP-binding protein [Pseudomonadota bacterium]